MTGAESVQRGSGEVAVAAWSLEQAHGVFPQVEGESLAALEESLEKRGPGLLFDLVAGLGLVPGAAALDVGCGEGEHALTLASRFGFAVTGIDPVSRHIEAARAAAAGKGLVFECGRAEVIPVGAASMHLVWCRDVLVHVAELGRAYAEFRRVLRPGGRALVYQMFGSELLEPCLWHVYAMIGKLTRRVYVLSSPPA